MSHGRFDNPVIASLAGFSDRFRKQDNELRFSEKERFGGKNCLITGANSGLGHALAVEMARRGARVVMANRTRSEEALHKARRASGSPLIEQWFVDLSEISTVYAFADRMASEGFHPDVTILNAGVALPKPRKTSSGQDEMFQVNYLSNVILTNLMVEKGIIPANCNGTFLPRIIFISSDSHQGCSAIDYSEFGRDRKSVV